MSKGLGVDQIEVYWSTNINIMKLASVVSCSYICIIISCRNYVVSKFDKEEWSTTMYAYRLLNIIEQNYSTTHKEVFAMVFALHKFKHYLLGNKFIFYVDRMALVYLVNKPHVSKIITRWLLLFLEYDFTIGIN